MSVQDLYKEKLCSPEEAVKGVKSGDVVDYGYILLKPVECDKALAARADELENVCIYVALTVPPPPEVAKHPKSFIYNKFCSLFLFYCVSMKFRRIFSAFTTISKSSFPIFLAISFMYSSCPTKSFSSISSPFWVRKIITRRLSFEEYSLLINFFFYNIRNWCINSMVFTFKS